MLNGRQDGLPFSKRPLAHTLIWILISTFPVMERRRNPWAQMSHPSLAPQLESPLILLNLNPGVVPYILDVGPVVLPPFSR